MRLVFLPISPSYLALHVYHHMFTRQSTRAKYVTPRPLQGSRNFGPHICIYPLNTTRLSPVSHISEWVMSSYDRLYLYIWLNYVQQLWCYHILSDTVINMIIRLSSHKALNHVKKLTQQYTVNTIRMKLSGSMFFWIKQPRVASEF